LMRSRSQKPRLAGKKNLPAQPRLHFPKEPAVVITLIALVTAIWLINFWWLSHDTRPPVWDMAQHQEYGLNFLGARYPDPTAQTGGELTGLYPPFVHWLIALAFLAFGPHPAAAAVVNLPATVIILLSAYIVAEILGGARAARWTCAVTAAIPYMLWMSRETILDYWLTAWVIAAIAALLCTQGFRNRRPSILLGFAAGLGLLTKWLFPLYVLFPILYVVLREKIWRSREQMLNAGLALFAAVICSGWWYFPRIPSLWQYFFYNSQVGAQEGEPEILSFQSFLYYIRLLEGYQLFALLFAVFVFSWIWILSKRKNSGIAVLACSLAISWIGLTLIRTKDPRFSMPLLPLLAVAPGAWIASWNRRIAWVARFVLALLLLFQLYLTNVGISRLPQEIVILRGYQGSLRWDWNLYMQHYFHILGPPRAEDWKQEAVLTTVKIDSESMGLRSSLGIVPDLPRLSVSNFHLFARLLRMEIPVYRLQLISGGVYPLANVDYVLTTDGDQGMPWTTATSAALTGIVANSDAFRLVRTFVLPGGSTATLYSVIGSRIHHR
jgi:4-amino-4-deoxy-L-arabinose transferase-like glycosyltransferase